MATLLRTAQAMASDPGAQNSSLLSPEQKALPETDPEATGLQTCRICGQDTEEAVAIFGEAGMAKNLLEKCQKCLPVLVS